MALNKAMIAEYFHMPVAEAAKELKVSISTLKRNCRSMGIQRWPYRKFISLQEMINNLEAVDGDEDANGESKELIRKLKEEKRHLEENPNNELAGSTKMLRQRCFRAKYKKEKPKNLGQAHFQMLDDLKEKCGSPRLHDCLQLWFKQEIREGETFAFLLRDCREHLIRVIHKRKKLIADMEMQGEQAITVECLTALKQTMAKDYNRLNVLTELVLDTYEGIREHKGGVNKMKHH